MIPVSYVNGSYLPHAYATTHIEDRGYQFADGAYEVIAFRHRCLIDVHEHIERLVCSLGRIDIDFKSYKYAILGVMQELIRRNAIEDGSIYLQVTRGYSRRSHVALEATTPSISMSVYPPRVIPEIWEKGVKVILRCDDRWKHCDIKSISLLANVMAKYEASRQEAWDSWYLDKDDYITEGATCNAYMVKGNRIMTYPVNGHILDGITRRRILNIASSLEFEVNEAPFSKSLLLKADEAFLSSSTAFIIPVIRVDEYIISDGKRGPITQALQDAYQTYMNESKH